MALSRHIAVASDGYLREWLCLGSLSGNPPHLLNSQEVNPRTSVPSRGAGEAGCTWRVVRSPQPMVDFMRDAVWMQHHVQCAAYLHLYVWSPIETMAFLALGSDDGAVVWMNGVRVFALDATRGLALDSDLVAVAMRSGWNRLLVKVLQYAGGWQFAARFLGPDRTVMKGLRYSLDNPLRDAWPREWADNRLLLCVNPPPEAEVMAAAVGDTLRFSLSVQNPADESSLPAQILVRDGVDAVLKTCPCPALAPSEQRLITVELSTLAWASAWRRPLRFQVFRDGTAISLVMELRPSVVETVMLLALAPPPGLGASGRARLRVIRADLAPGIEIVRAHPALMERLESLAEAMLDGSVQRTTESIRRVDREIAILARGMRRTGVDLVSHAHIDMNWLWQWPETVHICQDTFRQALAFITEFPSFVFNQSQASCYEAMQREAPALFAQIRRAVRAGRWHVIGGMWTEGDTNLSSGEAIARSFMRAQLYFRCTLGTQARTGWLPDNFGHTAQLPQLMRLAGIDSFYHMRCAPSADAQLYWWEAPDGSRVLTKTGVAYGGHVGPDVRTAVQRVPCGIGRQMIVYGVGDHGGGPTRKDITTALRYASSRLMPEVRLAAACEYFDTVRRRARNLPVHRGELNYTLTGCYTSVAAIKQSNRSLENALQGAEALSVSAALAAGKPWPADVLNSAWDTLVFNQFHDILPGSAIHESNRDSVARYTVALEKLRRITNAAFRAIVGRIGIERDDAIPIVVYNPLAWSRSDVVVAELVVTSRVSAAIVSDDRGRTLPAQVVRTRDFDCDFHYWIQFVAPDVPGLGYRTFYVQLCDSPPHVPVLHWFNPYPLMPGLPHPSPAKRRARGIRLSRGSTVSNRFFACRFDRSTGAIVSLCRMQDGRMGPEMISRTGANRLAVFVERMDKCSAWVLDPQPRGPLPVKPCKPVTVLQDDVESVSWMAEVEWGRSSFRLTTTVHAESPRIDCRLDADWLERGSEKDGCPMLRLLIGVAGRPHGLACDVPFAVVERGPNLEVPAQKWVDIDTPGGGLALLNTGKYGHSLVDNTLRLGLLRSFTDPDRLPDVGRHSIAWALYPHAGNWLDAGLPRLGFEYNVPLMAWQGRTQKGRLPQQASFVSVEGDPWFVVTGVKRAEDGVGYVVRAYDASGSGARAVLTMACPVTRAFEVDLLEYPLKGNRNRVTCRAGAVELTIQPSGILSVRVIPRGVCARGRGCQRQGVAPAIADRRNAAASAPHQG